MEFAEKSSHARILPLNPQSTPEYEPRERFTALERIGKLRVALWSLSLCSILGSFAFLSFLWASDDRNTIWAKIVVSGWAARSIAISSLLIRTAITFQAVDCTSMLACLVLRRFQTLLPDTANVAMIQHGNEGPLSMLLPLLRAMKHRKGVYNTVILLGLLTTTNLLQFTSELHDALRPTSWTGFIVVATVVILHLSIACVIAILFFSLGGAAVIGDAWLIASQLRSPDLKPWTGQDGRTSSRQVKSAMEGRGMEQSWAGLAPGEYRELITVRGDGDDDR